MPGKCVIGLQWGDEAKGKLVDRLTEGQEMVVRYQGGANAGHTVVVDGRTYKLHLIPSGILNESVLNIVSSGVVIDPATLLKEIQGLGQQGIDVSGRLLLSDRAHVVFPWHQEEDRIWNERLQGSENIGTTMRGIGPCYQDKYSRHSAIRLGDLLDSKLGDRIDSISQYKSTTLSGLKPEGGVAFDAETILADYRRYAEALRPYIVDTTSLLLDAVDRDARVLFEGAQGALLDIDFGTYPFVTSSNSSGVGITSGAGVPPQFIDQVLGVVKAYATRVGGGPFPSELKNEEGDRIRTRGREYGTTTGRPRRCGWFDAVAARYTARLSGATGLAVTMLDVLSGFDAIKICVAYEIDGERVDQFPSQFSKLNRVIPVFESMPGFDQDITGCTRLSQLPATARAYLDRLSGLVGVPVEYVSVGPERNQTIVSEPSRVAEFGGSRVGG